MNVTQRDIDAAIKATGRGEEWFNRALINQALDNLPGISAKTAVSFGDYSKLTNELGDCGKFVYECWRQWDGRIWNVQLLPELEDGVQILLAEFPGDRPDITEEALGAPGKPTLAQLGL